MKTLSRPISVVATAVALAGLAACSSPPRTTSASPAGYPQPVYQQGSAYPQQQTPQSGVEFGRVSRVEVMQNQEKPRGSGVGAVLGGVAGAVVGRQIGGGTGRDVATVAGAVGGAVAGNAIEKNRNTTVTESYRISIQMDNGSARAYDVPSSGELRAGDRVRIENGQISRL